MKPEVERVAVISTSHVTSHDMVLFNRQNITYPITVFNYEGGVIMPLLASEVLTQRQRTEVLDWGFSQSVVDLIMWAHQHNFQGVRLDRDGPPVSDLHTYDW